MQNRSNLSSVPLRFRMRADHRNFIPVLDWKEMSWRNQWLPTAIRIAKSACDPRVSQPQDKASGAIRHFNPQMKIMHKTLGDSAACLQDVTCVCLAPLTEFHGKPSYCV
jgi:hypothetical protein